MDVFTMGRVGLTRFTRRRWQRKSVWLLALSPRCHRSGRAKTRWNDFDVRSVGIEKRPRFATNFEISSKSSYSYPSNLGISLQLLSERYHRILVRILLINKLRFLMKLKPTWNVPWSRNPWHSFPRWIIMKLPTIPGGEKEFAFPPLHIAGYPPRMVFLYLALK